MSVLNVAFTTPPAPLTESARAVFRRIILLGRATRPMLGGLLDFSKPTMSAAILELSELGLVQPVGTTQGASGRKATVYGLGREAGYVIGVDAGATQVRAVAQTLDGTVLAEIEQTPSAEAVHLNAETGKAIRTILKRLRQNTSAHGPLRAVSVAVPVIVSKNRPELAYRADLDVVRDAIGDFGDAPVVFENNVNCATIAELDRGGAQGRRSFAYLQVGVKLGLGLVHDGRLFRGANGAAGEVARLPFPWSETSAPQRSGLEDYLGSHALMQRVRDDWTDRGEPPQTARELFELAANGSRAARRHVEKHAIDIGRIAASVVSIFDPGLIVMGGGVGQNELLLPWVRDVIAELTWQTEVTTSQLPARGTVLGASQLAVREAVQILTGTEHLPVYGEE